MRFMTLAMKSMSHTTDHRMHTLPYCHLLLVYLINTMAYCNNALAYKDNAMLLCILLLLYCINK